MTIAACYLSAEGVVFGADSTTTMFVAGRGGQPGSQHHYNFAQKVFEFGEPGATVAVVLWGLGSLGNKSHRTLIAETADEAKNQNLDSLEAIARLAASMFRVQYEAAFPDELSRAQELDAKAEGRNDDEEAELGWLCHNLSGGFCLGGRRGAARGLGAYEILFDPLQTAPPEPQPVTLGNARFWGCPNLIERLIFAMDFPLYDRILQSGKWTGTPDELFELIDQGALGQPWDLPLREAIDWVYASIYTTIKAMKFSHLAPVCGGPIEVAVISSDRKFRWVRHKRMAEAIAAQEAQEDRP
ncbi:MAG: hypothetical protein ABIF82_12090 [Planctomycetota bacterium]